VLATLNQVGCETGILPRESSTALVGISLHQPIKEQRHYGGIGHHVIEPQSQKPLAQAPVLDLERRVIDLATLVHGTKSRWRFNAGE
jgi:hypothetical protein